MAKTQGASTAKSMLDLGTEFQGSGVLEKKPNWVNLAQLDGPLEDSLTNRFLYKPALRFHGVTGGLWGQGLSDAHSVTSESRPPSYRSSRQQGGDGCSTCDVDTLYNTTNIPAQSPLTLRRRNTIAVILVAIGLLAAVAAVTGVILHFMHPKAMLRANVRFTVANHNFTDDMKNSSSLDFHNIARPLCEEMDVYFLTSELADFYLGCNVVSMRKDKSKTKNGTAVHYTLDFIENKVTNDGERIKKIIMRKSGRQKTDDTLYLVIRDFLVYLRSLKVDVQVLPLPDDHPGRKHRPRIPWNDDIDFIARKSKAVNASGANETLLTDLKQITQNVTEILGRKFVNISVDIPKMVLPGGAIHDLPIITPTPFHHSATPLQHANALHLSSVAAQMPVLSHVFHNVSVSKLVNVFKKEHVLRGDGAFVYPSKASVYSSVFRSDDFHFVQNFPAIQEVNVKNEVIAEQIVPTNSIGNDRHIPRHDGIMHKIETSFNDINGNFDNYIKATEVLPGENTYAHTENAASPDLKQKIFTIFTDVFLIMGSNSETSEKMVLEPTTSVVTSTDIEMQNQLKEFVENKVNIDPVPSSKHVLSPSKSISLLNIPPILMTKTASEGMHLTGMIQLDKPVTVLETRNRNDIAGTVDLSMPSTIDDTMQMNEIVVDVPVQEVAVPITDNIEWVNIFNAPQRTVKVHVGNVLANSGTVPIHDKIQEPVQNRNKNKMNTNLGVKMDTKVEVIQRKDTPAVVETLRPNIVRNNQHQNDFQNFVNNYFQLQPKATSTSWNNNAQQEKLNSEMPLDINQDVHLPRYPNPIQTDRVAGYYWPYLNELGLTNLFGTSDRNNMQQSSRNINKNSISTNTKVSDFTNPGNQATGLGNVDTSFRGNASTTVRQELDINGAAVLNSQTIEDQAASAVAPDLRFNVHNGRLNGRTAFILERGNRTLLRNNVVRVEGNIRQLTSKQPWDFLNRIGVNMALFDTSSTKTRPSSTIHQSLRRRQRPRITNVQLGNSLRLNRRDPRPSFWQNTNRIGGAFQQGRLMNINRNLFYPNLQMSKNWGLPKSPDFRDIADMKEILRQLVDNMYNMTTKIDHMQDAINFINKTFHETHRPLFNLEETLGNMTVSLGNLNQNLNSINATMNGFKDFLKQFGNTILNIDDVIQHIDKTIGNLGNAVSFIEYSMADLNGTVNSISDTVVDMNRTLEHVNRSVSDVNYTSTYSNETLDSMKNTLASLENAITSLAQKVNIINNDADVFDISLKNINDTVKNTHGKLERLHGKLQNFNSSMTRVVDQAQRLNETYNKINRTLQNMNEPYMFINGTVLEVIEKLSTIDERLLDLYKNMYVVKGNITVMNETLLESMDWMDAMVQTLTKFNLWVESGNETIRINIRNKDMIETVGMLLNMNGTLSEIGYEVDEVNNRLDKVDIRLEALEDQLSKIDRTLDNIDVKFKLLDKTLNTINVTVTDTDSSLNEINSTIKAMESTFNKVDISFGNINDTLDTVNKTLSVIDITAEEINATIMNVNRTFNDLSSTVNRTTGSAQQLQETISEFKGSVRELNSQLYNANESMRITRSKADIANESYRMLNNTLTQMEKTVLELQGKLDETNGTLLNTNTSLTFVNNSLSAMQNSFRLLSAELSGIQDSFTKMNASMHGLGTALPNIQASIQGTQNTMLELQDEITLIDEELHHNTLKRDYLVQKQSHLQDIFRSISEKIDLVQTSVDEIKNRSLAINNDIIVLKNNVNEAVQTYNKTERSVRYINETHDQIKNHYEHLQERAITTNMSLKTVQKEMDSINEDFKDFQKTSGNYSNIDVQIELVLSGLKNEISEYDNIMQNFQNETDNFKSVDKIIWNDNGDPLHVHEEFETLVDKTKLVNDTVNRFESVLNDTDRAVEDMTTFNTDMRSKLRDMYKLKNKIDDIENKETNLNQQIADTDQLLKDKSDNLTKLIDNLLEKMDEVQIMKNTYGNINGTYNSSELFEKLESTIRFAILELTNSRESVNNSEKDFQKAVGEYTTAKETYHRNVFNLSGESQAVLNNTLLVMEETELQANDVKKDIDKITNVVDDINFKIGSVEDDIKNLNNSLIYKKKKNNFVMKNRSLLELAFNRSFEKLNETFTMQKTVLPFLEKLKTKANMADERITEIPNVNISLFEEKTLIDVFITKVKDFNRELITSRNYLDTFYDRFVQFEESDFALDEVEKEYEKYTHAVEHFGIALTNISSLRSNIFSNANNISTTLDDILRQISEFLDLKEPVHNASLSVKETKSKFNSTRETINEAESHLLWLKDEFDRIRNNYTNFTATEIDLTESYVIEAMSEADNQLLNLTSDLKKSNDNVISLQGLYDTVENTYTRELYDRTNIDPTIQDIMIPTLKEIGEKSEKINRELDQINSKTRKLELSIKGVNETIHTTNKQLFIDRQKKLLADNKFPDLELSTEQANDSLSESLGNLNETTIEFNKVLNAYEELSVRLQHYSNVNISLDEFGEKLKTFNKSISKILGRLNKNGDHLNEINGTIWLEDGRRYSNNETVNDMKKRYQYADDMLDNIFTDIADIDSLIVGLKNGTDEVASKILSLNVSLNNLDDTNSMLDDLLNELSPIETNFIETKTNVYGLDRNFTNIGDLFRILEERFADINQSVYTKHVMVFQNETFQINDTIDTLINVTEATASNLTNLHNLFNLIKDINKETSNSQKDLDYQVHDKNKLFKNISDLLDNVRNTTHDIQRNVSYVEPLIHDLNTKLIQTETVFLRQEKLDYFHRYFPKNVYNSLNDTIQDVIKVNNDLGLDVKNVFQQMDKLKSNISNHENLKFNVSSIEDTLSHTDVSVFSNTEALQEMLENYITMEKLLYADDGSVVSDNETIDEMKTRYKTFGMRLDNITKELRSMKNSIDKKQFLLSLDAKKVDDYNSLIATYEDVSAHLYYMNNANEDWNRTAHAFKKLNSEQTDKFRSLSEDYDSICNEFNGTANNSIQQLKMKIHNSIKFLSEKLNGMNKSGINLLSNVSIAEEVANGYSDELTASHINTEPLRSILIKFPELNNTVDNLIYFVHKTNESLEESGNDVNNLLKALHNDVENLRQQLIAQEKQDYIEMNVPDIVNLLRKAERDINRTQLEIVNVNESESVLEDLHEAAKIITANESSIQVSLSPTELFILSAKKRVQGLQDVLNEGKNIIGSIDGALLNASESYFKPNDTLRDIKTVYEQLKQTLQNISKNMSETLQQKHDLHEDIHTEEIYLQSLKNESKKLQQLNLEHKSSIRDLRDLGKVLEETKERDMHLKDGIGYLRKSLEDIMSTYKDVNNTALHDNADMLLNEIEQFENKYSVLNDFINNTKENLINNTEESKHMDNILNNISRTLDELKAKTDKAEPVQDQMSADLKLLNSNIMNITNSIQQNLDIVPEMNKSIEDLRERFRKQEIYEYIKENFPTLLEEYDNVNRTLNNLQERIPNMATNLQDVREHSNDLIGKINEFASITIPVDGILDLIDHENNSLLSVTKEKEKLEHMLSNLESVISSNFNSNETLRDIKKRFAGYETTLYNMNQNISKLNNTLDSISREVNRTNNTIDMHKEALDAFKTIQNVANESDQSLKNVRTFVDTSESELTAIEESSDSQISRLDSLSVRFKDVNSSILEQEREHLSKMMDNFTETIAKTRKLIDAEQKSLEKLSKENDKVKLEMNQTITTIDHLKATTVDAKKTISDLSDKTQIIQSYFEQDFKPKVYTFNESVNLIDKSIDNLEKMFLEKEKNDYIKFHLPRLTALYEKMKSSLTETRTSLIEKDKKNDRLNQTIANLRRKMDNFDNINISTENEEHNHLLLLYNINDKGKTLNETSNMFNELNTTIFDVTDWSNYSIEHLNKTFDAFMENASTINKNLDGLNKNLDITDVTLNKNFGKLNETNFVLDEYTNTINSAAANEKSLDQIDTKLEETRILLEDVKLRFYHDGDRLHNLTQQYHGVTNSEIESLINETRTLLNGTVGLRIPLANTLFSNRILENYNDVSDRFDDVVYMLNDNYTTKEDLENVLRVVNDSLLNVTTETESMVQGEEFYRKDANHLSESLSQSNALLDKLEEMYEIQLKRDLLQATLPNLKDQWNYLNDSLRTISNDLNSTHYDIDAAKLSLENVEHVLNNISTVNIPTNSIRSGLSLETVTLKSEIENAKQVKTKLNEISIFNIDINELAKNKTISVSDIQEKLTYLNDSLRNLTHDRNDLVQSFGELEQNVKYIDKNISSLNNTLFVFKDVEEKANRLNQSVHQTLIKINSTASELQASADDIDNYKESIKFLQQKYEGYSYDSSDIELLLNLTDENIAKLNDSLSDSYGILSQAVAENDEINIRLYNLTDNLTTLNDSLEHVISKIPPTASKVSSVNRTLDNITNAIPDLNIVLQDLKNMLQEMNASLTNEDLKSGFVENTLPVLKDKYKITNMTFEMTNRTLQKMADEIDILNEFIETLKMRMNDFSTINISLSDIDANITHLENRLVIMQDHYNNVKDIVNKFRKDIRINNIFGRNISLSDVEDQYKSFNDSLDMINEVLAKIDNEAYEMDEHFEVLNGTMYKIDHALDRFETKQMNTVIMEKEMENLGKDLSRTNETITDVTEIVQNVSERFNEMQILYADVLQSTAENNTKVDKLLENTNQSLAGLQNSMKKLNELYKKVTNDFMNMNGTLFENINTYFDLNNTLDDVKNKYLKLGKSLKKLERGIDDATQDANGKSATLSELTKLLDFLNDTLYNEQVKFDFIENNLGNLTQKFNGIKTPIDTINKTVSKVTENISNASTLVKGVADKIKRFSNVHISLENDTKNLANMESNVTRINDVLQNIGGTYDNLKHNITQLDDRTGNMTDIVGKYGTINDTLDDLQRNLTDMLTALTGIDRDTGVISNITEQLDSALDKFEKLNKSVSVLNKNISDFENNLEITSSIIHESKTDANDLKKTLEDMDRLYLSLGNHTLLGNLTNLMDRLKETSKAVKEIQSSQNNLIFEASDTIQLSKQTEKRLNMDINDRDTLENINSQSEDALTSLENDTAVLQNSQNKIDKEAKELQDTMDILTNEILRLNDTLAEEKKKKEFIAKYFPEMDKTYNNLNSFLDSSNHSISNASQKVETVAKGLSAVNDRLNNITAITIPLDSENNEVLRIKKAVDDVVKDFKNVSEAYNDLKIEKLSDVSAGFEKLKDTYADFDKSMQDIKKNIDKMNEVINDINKTASVIKESVNDINSTVNEYIESGEMITDVAKSGDTLSTNIGHTNESIVKISDEAQLLHNTLNNLLRNYSHIKDPVIIEAKDKIRKLLKSSNNSIKRLEKEIKALGDNSENTGSVIKQMNQTHLSTKKLLTELKQHIKDVQNSSSYINTSLSDIETNRANINKSAENLAPDLKIILDKVTQLNDTLVKEQEKLDLIAAYKPLLDKRFKDLIKPLEKTNNHISFTDVKLADLKYDIKTVDSRLNKFRTLNITTEPELQEWNTMNHTVKNASKIFQELSEKYKGLQTLLKTMDDRNTSIEEMKRKFSSINTTLEKIEENLKNVNIKLTETENEVRVTEKTLSGLQTSMDTFKALQMGAAKTKQKLNNMRTKVQTLEDNTDNIGKTSTDIKDKIESMETTYSPLNNENWNKLQPKLRRELTDHINKLNQVNKSVTFNQKKLNSTAKFFNDITSEISTKHLSRKDVDSVISDLQRKLNSTTRQLAQLDKPLIENGRKLTELTTATNKTKNQVNRLNATLHGELLKYNYVNQHLPSLKEKYIKVNASYIKNIPNVESMQGQITQLVSIIDRIKEKMRQFGVQDTDNAIKKWDMAIAKLNSTVATVLKRNKEAGDKLIDLKTKLWSNGTMYTSKESLSDVIARIENYNKTLDEISAASHSINIKLGDLDTAASGVIGQLLERDTVLTTTPATTTPSGPPEWLTFQSTNTGIIGKDPGFATCAVEDLTQWEMMKITRVNKDGREDAIAAWKLGVGARKAVRDRRIRVKRTKTATGGKMTVGIQTLQCEDEGTYYCSIDSYHMWPLETTIGVVSPPEDNLKPDFPTEVFEDKNANFSCTGHPGYPNGRLTWKIKREKEVEFRKFDFYSSKAQVQDSSCVRTETNKVEYQFDLQWNNTKVRCYIENTDFYAEGIIRLLPYDICNKVRYLGTISHPYTPHKYIVCGKELNIMQCPGNTCYDQKAENCIRCKAGHAGGGDPCIGQPLFSYVAHETDCKKYYICMGPTKTMKKCTKGYFAPNIPGNCVMSYAQSLCGRKAG